MKLSKTALKLIKWATIISVASFLAVFYFFINHLFELSLGLAIGLVAAILRTVHLDLSLAKLESTILYEVAAAKRAMTVGLFARMLILLAALLISTILLGAFGLLGTSIGFLSIRFAAFFVKVPETTPPAPQPKGGEDTNGL